MATKKEARIAYIEVIPGIGKVLIVVFRGGWIDSIVSCEAGSMDDLVRWLGTSGYIEEIRGFETGENFRALPDAARLECWLKGLGIQKQGLPERNMEQVAVIMEGLAEYQRAKSCKTRAGS
ncbi:MAG: hypothetical protein H5T33_02490 [Candidatus Methanosuratus sp.]|nr:hypothetical protein [Candidatus Methanosuratincola sp.]